MSENVVFAEKMSENAVFAEKMSENVVFAEKMSENVVLCVGMVCVDVVNLVDKFPDEDTDMRTVDQWR